eukprot:6175430-Pleurochrysis_carterae.AAC.1
MGAALMYYFLKLEYELRNARACETVGLCFWCCSNHVSFSHERGLHRGYCRSKMGRMSISSSKDEGRDEVEVPTLGLPRGRNNQPSGLQGMLA